MKRAIPLVLLVALATVGCTSWQQAATDPNISGEDIVYLKDDRANLCYAVLFLSNKLHTKVRTMGMTTVPCESLSGVPAR